jgi:hypothetical protein
MLAVNWVLGFRREKRDLAGLLERERVERDHERACRAHRRAYRLREQL